MNVLVLTVFLSLCLAGVFLVLFMQDRQNRKDRSTEQDALLPFHDEDAPGAGVRDGHPTEP